MAVLDNDAIRDSLRLAWQDSQPETDLAHEEGGFILANKDGTLTVERWPRGLQNEIRVPPHPNGRVGEKVIVATFHTHPNAGSGFQQEPSLMDIRAVCGDPNLVHSDYEGEYVIATELTYRIRRNGDIEIIGKTNALLKLA